MHAETCFEGNLPGRGYAEVRIAGDRITGVRMIGPERADAVFLSPGLVDLQLNGFAGVDFSDPQFEPEDALRILPVLWSTGVTAFCPTLVTNSREGLARGFRVLEAARRADARFARMTPCYHLEGPFLSPLGSRGVHKPELMRLPDWNLFAALQEAAGGNIGIVTVAPELPGALEFIERAARSGVVVALGHTDGGPADIYAAIEAGARMSTHLGNGIAQVIDRHGNPIWAQLVSDRLSASIICDTFHLPPDLVKVILRMKGIERTILITDAVHVATLPPGKYSLVGTPIELQASGKVIKLGDSCLAGSALSMNRAVPLFMRQSDAPLPEALRAATMNPATLLSRAGLCREIAPGEPASLISFRFTPDALDIQTVCLAGEKVYSGASAAA